MAHGDVEIEIKTAISKPTFERLNKLLRKNARFIKKSNHVDDYYSPAHRNFLDPEYPFEWLNLRKRDGKILFNYKHWHPENVEDSIYCDEYEIEVSDKAKMEKILKALNFKKFVTVEKIRLVFSYKDRFEIALDEVKNLGFFIEIESLRDLGGVKKTRIAILDYARKLGIKSIVTIPGGYAAELLRRKGLLS